MRPFGNVLQELENGALIRDLGLGLEEVITAIRQTRKPGKLTLTLSLTPASKPHEELSRLDIEATIKLAPPQLERGGTLFFIDDHGAPTRKDPYQSTLDLQEVPRRSAAELRAEQ